jgi:hypothetical protein
MAAETGPSAFPALSLPALEGPPRDLSRAPHPALVVFGHAECATTRLLLPFAERIHRGRRAGTEVVVVLQGVAEEARALVSDLGLRAPVLLDPPPYALGTALRARTVPLTMVVRGGLVEETWPAFRRADLERAAELFGAAPLFGPEEDVPALRPG